MAFPFALARPWTLLFLLSLAPIAWLWWRGRNPHQPWREAVSILLRTFIVVLVTLALGGMQWVAASDEVAVVFMLDVSDSVDATANDEALAFVRAALAEMGPDDRAALVVFAAEALVERSMSGAAELGELRSVPDTSLTDVGRAVRLGMALLPGPAQRRLVLLSDGMVNVPGAPAALQLAAAGGVESSVVPLHVAGGDEALVEAIESPVVLYEGEATDVVVRIQSTVAQPALLRLYADRTLVAENAVHLRTGANVFTFGLLAGEPGFRTLAAQLVPTRDTLHQNNALSAFSVVEGAPTVLVVARAPYEDRDSGLLVDDAAHLVPALESAGLKVETVVPGRMPADLVSLGSYASVVLVNVPAADLGPRRMDLLQSALRDLGVGLVCVGGQDSYGVGGYYGTALQEALPVDMTIKDRERLPQLAIVFVFDRSGSMGAPAAGGGALKIDLAKEAVLRSLELLNPGDQVGVVAFDSVAAWVWPLAELDDSAAIQNQVATVRAGGGTSIHAGLGAAVGALEGSDAAGGKHIILLTDGGASQEGLDRLVDRLRAVDGTLSVVGVGQDAAPFLQQLAIDGGGRYHFTDNPATIPSIFLQETALAQRAYIVEEPFYPALAGPSPILDGITSVPPLYGYVATSAKPLAQQVLVSGFEDPILAKWQYGLGRSAAWTSDAKAQWARAWVRWEQFPRFWGQTVRWTISERDTSGMEVHVDDQGAQARIVVDVVGEEGAYGDNLDVRAHLVSPELDQETVPLQQVAPGRYEGTFAPHKEGAYLVYVEARDGDGGEGVEDTKGRVTGFVRAYSPEYRDLGTDAAMLEHLADVGGRQVLSDPAAVFARRPGAEPARAYTDIWPWLLAAALFLLPFDVAVRRVVVTATDLRRAVRRVRERLVPPARQARRAARTARLSRLMEAKRRAAAPPEPSPERGTTPVRDAAAPARVDEPALAQADVLTREAPPREAEPEPMPSDEGQSTTARLLAAKRRARDRDDRER